eukprot:305975-Prymnesium_polylepis.2
MLLAHRDDSRALAAHLPRVVAALGAWTGAVDHAGGDGNKPFDHDARCIEWLARSSAAGDGRATRVQRMRRRASAGVMAPM